MKARPKKLFVGVAEDTTLSPIWAAVSEMGLVAVQIGGAGETFSRGLAARFGVPAIPHKFQTSKVVSQIQEYLQGMRKSFEIEVHWGIMSEFQQKALQAVCQIPYGETRTYGQIAAEIGVPQAPRAIGRANATNPMPLVIPCHRLVGADGSLRGYGGGEGIKTKDWLLTLERSHV
jgi:methylated-DNA-[protein]-cysteine S-methyltransferase